MTTKEQKFLISKDYTKQIRRPTQGASHRNHVLISQKQNFFMLTSCVAVASIVYHLIHLKLLARDWLQTQSQLRILIQDINRTQKLLRTRKRPHGHHVLELEEKKQRTLEIFLAQGQGIGLLGIATSDHVMIFTLTLFLLETNAPAFWDIEVTQHLGSFFRIMIWVAMMEIALLVRLTMGLISNIVTMWRVSVWATTVEILYRAGNGGKQ
jgi:hypothetical protein